MLYAFRDNRLSLAIRVSHCQDSSPLQWLFVWLGSALDEELHLPLEVLAR